MIAMKMQPVLILPDTFTAYVSQVSLVMDSHVQVEQATDLDNVY